MNEGRGRERAARGQASGTERRSVLVFLLDQLSAKWVEQIEERDIAPLPNIRRLKRSGVCFANAFTSNPLCCPARATIATGLATRGHGVLDNGYRLDHELPTFMQAMQSAGWTTGAFGKLHFHPHHAGLSPDFRPYGFDVTSITQDPRAGAWLDWVERVHPQHYEAALATADASMPGFAMYGPDRRDLQSRIHAIQDRFVWATPEFPESTPAAFPLPFPEEVSQTSWITREALRFLDGVGAGQPLLAHVGYVQPHHPYQAPADYIRMVDPEALLPPLAAEWTHDPCAPWCFSERRAPESNWRHVRRCYFADVAHLDCQLGLLLDKLDETGRTDSTYVILLADHGDLLFDHGFVGKRERHYDACIRVPLVISGPGARRGVVCTDIVQLEDICPTILEIAGLQMPGIPARGENGLVRRTDIPRIPGRSLLPLCRGDGRGWRDAAYCESYNTSSSNDPRQWARTVRTLRYRYTMYPGDRGEQLFDLSRDADEQTNLAASGAHAPVRRELRDLLLEAVILQDHPKTPQGLYALGVY